MNASRGEASPPVTCVCTSATGTPRDNKHDRSQRSNKFITIGRLSYVKEQRIWARMPSSPIRIIWLGRQASSATRLTALTDHLVWTVGIALVVVNFAHPRRFRTDALLAPTSRRGLEYKSESHRLNGGLPHGSSGQSQTAHAPVPLRAAPEPPCGRAALGRRDATRGPSVSVRRRHRCCTGPAQAAPPRVVGTIAVSSLVSSLVSSVYVRTRSSVFKSMQRCRSRT